MLIQYVINSSKYGRVAMYCLNNIFLEELYSISIYLASSQRKYIGTIERKCLDKEKSLTRSPAGLVWNTEIATVSLFWDTYMAAETSCENTLLTTTREEN